MAFKDADIALLVGARPRGPGMERKDLLEANGKIFTPQGQALNDAAKRDVKVLVVGNPANTNCLIAMKNAPDLRPAQLHRDDAPRPQPRHSRRSRAKIGKPVAEHQEGDRLGQPLGDAVPRHLPGRIDGKKVWPMINDQAWLEGTFIPTVQKRGAAIIEARGLSSAASAANAAIDHVRDWVLGTRRRLGHAWAFPPTAATASPRA